MNSKLSFCCKKKIITKPTVVDSKIYICRHACLYRHNNICKVVRITHNFMLISFTELPPKKLFKRELQLCYLLKNNKREDLPYSRIK